MKSGQAGACLSQGRRAGLPHPVPSAVSQPWQVGSEAISSWHIPGAHQLEAAARREWRIWQGAHTELLRAVPPEQSVCCRHQGLKWEFWQKSAFSPRLWQKVKGSGSMVPHPQEAAGLGVATPPVWVHAGVSGHPAPPSWPRPPSRGLWDLACHLPGPSLQTTLPLRQAGCCVLLTQRPGVAG